MKILYTTHSFPLPEHAGDARFFTIAKWFSDRGHEVTVLCSNRHQWNDEIIYTGKVDSPQILHNIKIVGLATPKGRRKSKLRRIINYLVLALRIFFAGRKLPKQDMVIAGTPPLFTPVASLLLARKFKAFSVLEARDMYPKAATSSGIIRQPLLVKLWHWYEVFLRRSYDHNVVALPRMKEWFLEQGVKKGRVTIVTNGYDAENDKETEIPQLLEHYFTTNSDKFTVGYFGCMGLGHWNIRGIVESAKELKSRTDISFLLVGDGEQRIPAENYALENDVENCHFFPACSHRQVFSAMRKCNALLMVYKDRNYEEILPVKLFDYLGTGKPIIFCGKGDGPDLLARANGGIVFSPFTPARLAESIEKLADNSNLCRQYGNNGLEYMKRHLLREKVYEKWNEVIDAYDIYRRDIGK